MRMLDIKLLRDLRRLWAQSLAIALVLAAGVATLVLSAGAYQSLEETRAAYYDRYRFADVFASVKRAPLHLRERIELIPGVATVSTRIAQFVLLDLEDMVQPATGMAISVPDHGQPALNRLFVRQGRLPGPASRHEVVLNTRFAAAHGLTIGSRLQAIINGRKIGLQVVGLALSPEFIYALGPGDLFPDDRRFGVLWMSESVLASLFDLEQAFNSVAVKLLRGARESDVLERLDALLDRYGGTAAYGRKDQQSNAYIEAELTQLQAMSRVIPPIFLLVSAFLINMTLARLIALDRERIGLLKAVGYGSLAVASHYLKMALAIALLGSVIGLAAGAWLGRGLTRLYANFFDFPFLIFKASFGVYAVAVAVALAAAAAGAAREVYRALSLAPAVAMAPPAPPRYTALAVESLGIFKAFSQLAMMTLRNIVRWPLRTALTILGIATSVALLIVSFFSLDAVELMIDANFFRAERQHATISFVDKRPLRVLEEVERLPGVLRAEPVRSVPVRLKNGHRERKIAIQGKAPDMVLSRVLDLDLLPVALPQEGLVLSQSTAEALGVGRGSFVDVEVLEGRRPVARLPVSAVIQSYFGLLAYMDLGALSRLLGEAPTVTGAHIAFDPRETRALFGVIKTLPAVSAIALQRVALERFRQTLAENIFIMTSVYVVLSVIVAVGVVYNAARIQLSERAHEFATLRVMGFTRWEVSRVLLTELAMIVLAAVPLGWIVGYGFARLVTFSFESDLYRIPFVIENRTYAVAALVAIAAAVISGLMVRRRIDTLDLVVALKTRE